jgi:TolA-binding protein
MVAVNVLARSTLSFLTGPEKSAQNDQADPFKWSKFNAECRLIAEAISASLSQAEGNLTMAMKLSKSCLIFTLAAAGWTTGQGLQAAQPTAEQALKLNPLQKDVEVDRPTAADAAKCTIKAEKIGSKTGWVIRDASGNILRNFVDTNNDNVVDQWSYFKSGVEMYRDVDSNFNGKADQCRWLNLAGTRWGIDKNEDGQIDTWKMISAEEVTAEVVAAIANQDARRFERLMATPAEIKSLDIDAAKAKEIEKNIAAAGQFSKLVREKKVLTPDSKWIIFGGGRPGAIPAGGDGTNDLVVYENVTAMVENGGKNDQLLIGTLVRVGDNWRLIDMPAALTGANGSTFFGGQNDRDTTAEAQANQPNELVLQAIKRLEEIDAKLTQADSPEDLTKLNTERADLLEELASTAKETEDRATWLRQLADTVLAAVQTGSYNEGAERLNKLADSLSANAADAELAAYAQFRLLKAEYYLAQQKGTDYVKVQEKWLADLEKFVADHPKNPDAAEAMMELALAQEFAGNDTKALGWYTEIVSNFPNAASFGTAKGAMTRLDSVGKPITVQGKKFGGQGNASLANYKGKVVLIHYWSSDYDICKAEIPQLQEMWNKYAKQGTGFTILSIGLDRDLPALQEYLAGKKLPWEMIYEPGGFQSRLAVEMGINTLPTMLLVDKQGRVINRNIHAAELDSELRKLLVNDQRQATRKQP